MYRISPITHIPLGNDTSSASLPILGPYLFDNMPDHTIGAMGCTQNHGLFILLRLKYAASREARHEKQKKKKI